MTVPVCGGGAPAASDPAPVCDAGADGDKEPGLVLSLLSSLPTALAAGLDQTAVAAAARTAADAMFKFQFAAWSSAELSELTALSSQLSTGLVEIRTEVDATITCVETQVNITPFEGFITILIDNCRVETCLMRAGSPSPSRPAAPPRSTARRNS